LDGELIECPLHAARFDVRTGKVLDPPATEDLKTFPVRVVDGEIQVKLD
jgi:nitrite reductase/ring-hydroxylating ferredoxin subunit